MPAWPTNAVQRWQIVRWSFHHVGIAFVFDGDKNLEKPIREHIENNLFQAGYLLNNTSLVLIFGGVVNSQ